MSTSRVTRHSRSGEIANFEAMLRSNITFEERQEIWRMLETARAGQAWEDSHPELYKDYRKKNPK
jgi:hypothetical protein